MTLQEEIDQLKKHVFSDEWNIVKTSTKRLGEIGGEEVTIFLISLLKSDDVGLRNCAALELERIRDNRTVNPLLEAIFKKENHNRNGTLVFALEALDCSDKLKEIFSILFYETFEAKISAYSILSTQKFYFTKKDILEIQAIWEDIKLHPEKCPDYEVKKAYDMIEDAVAGWVSHLEKEAEKE